MNNVKKNCTFLNGWLPLVRHCLVGAHAAGCAQAEPQTATDDDDVDEDDDDHSLTTKTAYSNICEQMCHRVSSVSWGWGG